LIIKNDGVGDLILASGLISSVGKIFDGNVDLLTCDDGGNREIAEGIEPLRERFYVSLLGMKLSNIGSRIGLLMPRVPTEDMMVLKTIASRKYETAICLRRFIRESTLIVMRQVRAEKKYCMWEFPTNVSLRMVKRHTHGWKHYIGAPNTLSEQSYSKAFLESVLNSNIASRPRLSFCQKQISKPTNRKVALGLGGRSATWPYGNWIELAMRLAADGCRLILLGGDTASHLASQIIMKVPSAENLVGQLTWHKTAELLHDCEGYIGNDTGLSHFASLILQKAVVILGGGTFRRFFPWPDAENQYVIFHGLGCFDCTWECKFRDRLCLSLVRPCDVMAFFREVMNGRAKPECDLNPANLDYILSWRCKKNIDVAWIRAPK